MLEKFRQDGKPAVQQQDGAQSHKGTGNFPPAQDLRQILFASVPVHPREEDCTPIRQQGQGSRHSTNNKPTAMYKQQYRGQKLKISERRNG